MASQHCDSAMFSQHPGLDTMLQAAKIHRDTERLCKTLVRQLECTVTSWLDWAED